MLEAHAVKLCYCKCIIQGLSFTACAHQKKCQANKYTGYKHANSSFDKHLKVYE